MGDATTAQTGAKSEGRGAWLVPVAALAMAALFLFAPLSKLGIWDPYELDAADLARRIAIWIFPHPSTRVWRAGALPAPGDPLWLPDVQNAMPTLSDPGIGDLPFTSMAAAFRVFGLHEWTGRVPLA